MKQEVILSNHIEQDLLTALHAIRPDRLFILADETTHRLCLPKLKTVSGIDKARQIVIPPTDAHKQLDTLSQVWKALSDGEATRHSCLLNLGGGMVTDLGGFAASTFKRGIPFINLPTTLLAMVDAAVGGKTGINFNHLKNEVGTFANARYVLLHTTFLDTLDAENLRSGYAEMLKHALIKDEKMWAEHLNFPLEQPDFAVLQRLVAQSVEVKEQIVAADPHEQGLRKVLNLGHTIGHALEALWLQRGQLLLHGYAVAYGLIVELYLSALKTGFPTDRLRQMQHFIRRYYGTLPLTCNDYPTLLSFMHHDKKNISTDIHFTLLADIGAPLIDQTATEEEIKDALDFYREG
ncbi:3-dehydroquinate synthase [Prevotella sp. oral taxon 475]|uniref:3-dehydroquinate synthase n=1 Tax=Prevotella sp. oral taxon 475 TaxID=712471 RepID=UPI001BAB81BB|nr:3-dehydroquinate synthase [Prevotella sp. oral taxon 475]QUB47716.1 3-dehydroquinate synthase [Prevotella sp. oral taxon 475]